MKPEKTLWPFQFSTPIAMNDNIGQEHVTDLVTAELQRLREENTHLRDNIDALIGQRERLKAELRDAAQLIQGFIDAATK